MLVDPGTYRYSGEPDFRRYFKGIRAHNTVSIDGMDQSVQETSFIWSKPYKLEHVRCGKYNGRTIISALHTGYSDLKKPVKHKRELLFF